MNIAPANDDAIKVLIVMIHPAQEDAPSHVFVHGMLGLRDASEAIKRASDFYRRQERYSDALFRFKVSEVMPLPKLEEGEAE